MGLLLAPLLYAQGEIEGKAVNSVTGAGIEGVQVEIALADSKTPSYRPVTDSAGEFRLSAVSEGAYTVTYKKPGFAGTEYDRQNAFTVSASSIVHLRRELDPLAILRGRTAPHIMVELLTGSGQIRKSVPADDRGDFRFEDLLPGAYLLRANPNRAAQASLDVQSATGLGQEKRVLLAPAYYPGVADRVQASVIQVRGGELTGYDIRLRPGPVFNIRGRLLDVQGKPLPHFSVELLSADAWDLNILVFRPEQRAAREKERAQLSSAEDGSFEFANVSPGNWHLVAGSPTGLLGVLPVTVTRHDLENLTLRLAAPFFLDVAYEGLTERPPQVHLIPASGFTHHQAYSGNVDDSGKEKKVRVHMYPDRYRFSMGSRPGYYLAAIMMGERDVLGEEIELAEGTLPIRMVYKSDGGRVTGTVEKGEWCKVVLAPKEPAMRSQWELARCDAEGRFEAGDLRPGDYLVIAIRHPAVTEDPLWLATLDRHASSVHVDANQTVSLTLRVQ